MWRALVTVVIAVVACSRPAAADTHAPLFRSRQAQVDPQRWLSSRGIDRVEDMGSTGGCVELVVGPAHEAALLCDDDEMVRAGAGGGFWHFTRSVVRVVRAGKIVSVLEVRTQILDEDRAPVPDDELQLRIPADGMSATVDDRGDCAARPTFTPEIEPDVYFDGWRRLCRERGRFRWKSGHFQRVR